MMKILRKIHLYLGLLIGAALLLTAVTGTILVYREELILLSMDDKPDYHIADAAHTALALETLIGDDVRFIDFPRPTAPWYRVWREDGRITYHQPMTFDSIPVRYQMSDMMMFLADLHIHFLGGETGEVISGYLGILVTFMILSGLYIWWPMRSGFAMKKIMPRNLKRGEQLKSHRSMGTFMSIMLIVVVVTGVALVFNQQSQKIISLFSGEKAGPIDIIPVPDEGNEKIHGYVEFTRYFFHHIQDGIIARYYPPQDGTRHRIRYKYPEDWATYGASFLIADFNAGKVTGLQDYRSANSVTRISRKYYPLHAGKWGNSEEGFALGTYLYKMLLALTGTALIMLIFTGYMSWFKKKRR